MTSHAAVRSDGTSRSFDAVIWCVGCRPALNHLVPLGNVKEGRQGGRSGHQRARYVMRTSRSMTSGADACIQATDPVPSTSDVLLPAIAQ